MEQTVQFINCSGRTFVTMQGIYCLGIYSIVRTKYLFRLFIWFNVNLFCSIDLLNKLFNLLIVQWQLFFQCKAFSVQEICSIVRTIYLIRLFIWFNMNLFCSIDRTKLKKTSRCWYIYYNFCFCDFFECMNCIVWFFFN